MNRSRKKQSRLSFQPLPSSSSPARDSCSKTTHRRLASVRVQGVTPTLDPSVRYGRSKDDSALPTPDPSSQPDPFHGSHRSPSPDRSEHAELSQQESGEDEDEIVLPSSKRRRLENIRINSSQQTPTRKSARLKSSPHTLSARRRSQDHFTLQNLSDIASAESSADEEKVLQSTPLPARKRKGAVADDSKWTYESAHKEADFLVDDDEIEYVSSDPDVQPSRKKKPASGRGRRSRQEQDELDEDLADLQDSDVDDTASRARTRGGPITTKKDRDREHLNLLKQRRLSQRRPLTVISDEDENGDEDRHDDSDGVDIDEIAATERDTATNHEPDDEDVDGDAQEPDPYDHEVGEDDFVVDDDDEPDESHIDRPHPDIPLAFTSFATRKPKELFVYVIEWLVKNKIAPAFSRSDELYDLSWNKLSDQIKAQAGSRLISSAWNVDFKNTILTLPHMKIAHIADGDDEAYMDCDACNRTNHPARYQFQFEGRAYNKETLEPIDDSDDENENEDNDTESSPATLFYLGSHCAANAEMGHKLTHWKYHLNASLLAYLEEQGVLSPESVIARERCSKKKREKEAEGIVDDMQATGVVDEMWQGMKADLNDARYGMEDHFTQAGRSKARIGKVRVNRGNGLIEEWGEKGCKTTVIVSDSDGD